jgi:dienelactone hydrolase
VAKQARHPEIATVKLALYGFSATGSFVVSFAARYPARTLTAVRYHSHLRGLSVDTAAAVQVPMLFIGSVDDSTAGVDDIRAFWLAGRRIGAPWALAVETGRDHSSLDSWYATSDLIWHWIESLGKQRTATDGSWYADMATRSLIRSTSAAAASSMSWFPDSTVAAAWRRLHTP